MMPRYPIFIPSRGRAKTPLTIRALENIGVPYTVVVEPQEADAYRSVVRGGAVLALPHSDKGLTVTRNWIWDHAQSLGVARFWTMDDNIREFYRLHRNVKVRMEDGTGLRVIEDFADRYANAHIVGMNYRFLAKHRQSIPPIVTNTRVYSNMLIRTDIPYRNRLFFNDDTDLCLQVLKGGGCIVQFNAFLADKMHTMSVKGGMTEAYQATDKRLQFARELQRAHPDVVRVVWKFNRWHHQVDYRPFRANRLRLRPGVVIPEGVNNYGMVLVDRTTGKLSSGNGAKDRSAAGDAKALVTSAVLESGDSSDV